MCVVYMCVFVCGVDVCCGVCDDYVARVCGAYMWHVCVVRVYVCGSMRQTVRIYTCVYVVA